MDRGTRRVLLAGVRSYQLRLSWLLGGQCRFVPSCSCYAAEALVRGRTWKAVPLIVWRIARCQPFCRAGEDPVPEGIGTDEEKL